MRLRSLTVRNYRLHGHLSLEFDPSRNLIGGPNESGKSTLAEAVHRALFLRHRCVGEARQAMVSDVHHGHPEVRLVFEAAGRMWTLDKRFSGANGTARLAAADGATLHGDAAEEKLAELTGNQAGAVGKLSQLAGQWPHLWVWQGTAGTDASVHAASRRDELVQRLQQDGLAAVMQSETDERVREAIRGAYDELFTQAGKVKAGSTLDASTRELERNAAALAAATAQLQRLEQAAAEQEAAHGIIAGVAAVLPGLRAELAAVGSALDRVRDLRFRAATENDRLAAATAARQRIAENDRQIQAQAAEAAAARAGLQPAEQQLALLAQRESAARSDAEAAEHAWRAATDTGRRARQHHDLARARVIRLEKVIVRDQLQQRTTEAAALEQSVTAEREALAALPPVDAAALEQLRDAHARLGRAEAALDAIAARIELVASDQPVLLDGTALDQGQPRVVTGTAELAVGPATVVRIHPGGGESLAEARANAGQLRQQLAAMLEQSGVPGLTEAAGVAASRQAIGQRIRDAQARLDALDARSLPAGLAAANEELAAATAAAERCRAALTETDRPAEPGDLAQAREQVQAAAAALQLAEEAEAGLQAEAAARRGSHRQAELALSAQQEAVKTGRDGILQLDAAVGALEQSHGDAAARQQALAGAAAAEEAAKASAAAVAAEIAALNPEGLETERTRLERVIAQQEANRLAAENRRAAAQALLRLDGSADPEADLREAAARHAAAQEAHAREQRRADAIALVHRLFTESQADIDRNFTQPIADRIAGYLECVFGPGTRVDVDLATTGRPALRLLRPDAPSCPFEGLGGGAKEQVAAAVRLAVAEILAANHDGCLPVVFDDAFAFADPVRVQTLQRMLDLAARRGLQVLVLSCTPADYLGLGAREHRLASPPPHPATTPAAAAAAGSHVLTDAPAVGAHVPTEEPPAAARRVPTEEPPPAAPPDPEGPPPPAAGGLEPAFLAALRALGGKAGNRSLRAALGWDEAGYDAVKRELVARRLVIPGKGRGGSVSLPPGA